MFAWKQWSFFVPSFQAMSREVEIKFHDTNRLSPLLIRWCLPNVHTRLFRENLLHEKLNNREEESRHKDEERHVPAQPWLRHWPATKRYSRQNLVTAIQFHGMLSPYKNSCYENMSMASNFQEFWCPKGSHCYQVLAKEKKKDSEH